jgi:hypothetical protein
MRSIVVLAPTHLRSLAQLRDKRNSARLTACPSRAIIVRSACSRARIACPVHPLDKGDPALWSGREPTRLCKRDPSCFGSFQPTLGRAVDMLVDVAAVLDRGGSGEGNWRLTTFRDSWGGVKAFPRAAGSRFCKVALQPCLPRAIPPR